jgi:hypothetical protein
MKKTTIYTVVAALLLAVVAFFFFYPDDAEGRVLQQQDIQQGLANGQEGKLYYEQTGEITRWTDALFGGMPTFQINPSYPANSWLGWLTKVYTLGLPSPANLLFGMMLGFFIMCLCMRVRWQNALFGAIAWGFSSYFIIIIGAGHIWKFLTLMYIPPTIGGIALCYRGKYLQGGALTALFGALQIMSNHIQMSYYFIFVIIAMMIAWFIEAYKDKKLRQWGLATLTIAAAGVVAVAANASSLYNTYQYSKETTRGKATEIVTDSNPVATGPDLNYITQWSYGKSETFSLLIPNVKGGASVKPNPDRPEEAMKSLYSTDKAMELYESGKIGPEEYQFLAQFTQYFGDQPMTNGPVYVGVIVFLLAILALFVAKGPMKWALFAVSLLAMFLSWGNNMMWLTELFVNVIPGYGKFRTVASILVIVEFTLPLLAVMCLREIIKNPDSIEKIKLPFYIVFGAGVAICFIGWLAPGIFGNHFSAAEMEYFNANGVFGNSVYYNILNAIKEVRMSMVSADCLRSLIFIILGAAVILPYIFKVYRNPYILSICLATLTLIDMYSVDKRYLDSDNFTNAMEQQTSFNMTNADRAILKDKSHYRVLDLGDFSGARSSYFHKTIGGYHAAKLTRYQDLITYQLAGDKMNMNVLNMLNAKYFMNGDEYQLNPDAQGNAWFVDNISYVNTPNEEMAGLDSLDTRHAAVADAKFKSVIGTANPIAEGDTIYLTSYAPNHLTYKAKSAHGGVALFSEIYFPWGWNATIDGKTAEIGRANYVLRALSIPAGDHVIDFKFDPQSTHTTDSISTIALIIIYLCAIGAITLTTFTIIRRKKEQQ